MDKSIAEVGANPGDRDDPLGSTLGLSGLLGWWSSLEGSALAYPSLCLPRLGFDSLLIQFQVLSQKGKWLNILQSKNKNFCWHQTRVMVCTRELTTDLLNLSGSTVVSLSFCNRVMNGDSWDRCFGENKWVDYVYTPVIHLLGRTGVGALA